MASAKRQSSPDEWRWFRHPEKVWALGYVCDAAPGALRDESTYELWEESGGGVFQVSGASTHTVDASHLEDLDDVARMNDLHEAPLLSLLERRFAAGSIYTWTGDILLSVNPYVDIPHLYTIPPLSLSLPALTSVPHVFAVAERAYRSMLAEPNPLRRNQSLIVSGESGAGKTEACKHIMRYLAVLSQRFNDAAERKARGLAAAAAAKLLGHLASPDAALALATGGAGLASPRDEASIERKVLECNPFLEAFGNSKTARNDNSSRFGKFTCIEYDGGRIAGAQIRTFLLEKARVVRPARTDRNYHIFYQLLRGASDEERQELLLGEVSDYTILNNEADERSSSIAGVDDMKEFESTRAALSTIGVPPRDQHELWRVVAAILHLGNVTFRRASSEVDNAAVHDVLSVDVAGRHLGCPTLATKLVRRLVRVRGRTSTYEVALTERQAASARDSLAKALYERLFGWLIGRTNDKLSSRKSPTSFIGILDIFGFEIFDRNSFEQLCINYANEKLQALFNHHIFVAEEELYRAEDIDVSHISFTSNLQCIELIENKSTGLLPLLDEVCMLTRDGTTDNDYLEKIDKQHRGRHPFYEDSRRPTPGRFSITHFAGRVVYSVEGFLEKNVDTLTLDLDEMAQASTEPFVAGLFSSAPLAAPLQLPLHGSARDHSEGSDQSSSNGGAVGGKTSQALQTTISTKFRAQLSSLHDAIAATTPHYVRCIKPNSLKRPSIFERRPVLSQLLYAGVLEAVRIRRQGFPVREDYGSFWRRSLSSGYSMLLPKGRTHALPLPPPDYVTNESGVGYDASLTPALVERAKSGVRALLENVLPAASWRLGRTKVFLAYGASAVLAGALRATAARRLQSWCRMVSARLRYRHLRAAILSLQRKHLYRRLRRKYASAESALVRIQSHWRRRHATGRVNSIRSTRERAASKVGATVLAWRTAAAYRALLARIRRFQAIFRSNRMQRVMHHVRVAAIKLHAFGRMVPPRAAELRRRVMRTLAAVSIQRLARGAIDRRKCSHLRRAATRMQALLRGRLARKVAAKRSAAAFVITGGLRRGLACRARAAVRAAIIKIQSWWRGSVVRRKFFVRRRSIRRVQRAARAAFANRALRLWVADLHAAASCGSVAQVDAVLFCKSPEYTLIRRTVPLLGRVNARNWRDGLRSPLHVAAARPDGDSLVEHLLLRGAEDDTRDAFLATPVHAAAMVGDLALPSLRRLLLRRTARDGDRGAVAALSAKTRAGKTPIEVARAAAARCAVPNARFDATIAFLKEYAARAARGASAGEWVSGPPAMSPAANTMPAKPKSPVPSPPPADPALMLLVIAERERARRAAVAAARAERIHRTATVIEALGKKVDVARAIEVDAKPPPPPRVVRRAPSPVRKVPLLDIVLQKPVPKARLKVPAPISALTERQREEREQMRIASTFLKVRPNVSTATPAAAQAKRASVKAAAASNLSPKGGFAAIAAAASEALRSDPIPNPSPLPPPSPLRPERPPIVRELVEVFEAKIEVKREPMVSSRLSPLLNRDHSSTSPVIETDNDWVAVTSSSLGLPYWFNKRTGESQWNSPGVPSIQPPAQLRAIDNPEAWTVRATREGVPFYECAAAGVVTWARPRVLQPLGLVGCDPIVSDTPPPRSDNISRASRMLEHLRA